ncbi:putative sodium-coupled neutral amino acid transporter 11 [Tigriopus californicus]|uniref:putative sodium-coupled neutral amino acid transporter 11 n=1 Tax=Tigriopus californicus TaxID=6832 RepID=UPI0027DA0FA3|nr:putative sodium-coupled neutral amino acid transporter 11 [Tigriopus californicus]
MSKKTLPFTHIMASKMEKGHRDNQDNVNLKKLGPKNTEDCNETSGLVQGRDFGSTESEVCFNYINSIIGSGIIGIPYAFKATGIGLGVMVLCLAGGLVNLSLRLLMKAGEMSETKSYQELMCFSFGYPGFWVITFLQFAYPCTAMTTYNIIVGDTVTTILVRLTGWDPSHFLVRREFVILMITLVVTLPLSLYRNIGKLSKVSFLSLIFTAFVTVVIYVRIAPMMDIVKDQTQVLSWFDMSGFAEGVGILSLTFMCHHNSFLLFNSMANPSISKWNQVTNWSVGISMIVVLLLGFGGYVTFRGGTQGDVLNNYCWGDDLANVARLVFCVTVLFTYPIECFVCREVFENIITGFIGHFERTTGFHYLLTIILVALPCALSMGTSCLGIVLDLNGLGFALPLAYILPGICYLRVNNGSWYDWDNMVALMLATFGIGVTVIGISQLVFAGAEECIHDQELPYCAKSNFTHILPRVHLPF